jgi:hypothetical protein
LGAVADLPVIELDRHFWKSGLKPTSKPQWAAIQRELTAADRWILDGDLADHDLLELRLQAADTIIVLDFSLWRCVWRVARRSVRTPSPGGGCGTTVGAACR